jgi:predicted metalloprotease with PDZ domain
VRYRIFEQVVERASLNKILAKLLCSNSLQIKVALTRDSALRRHVPKPGKAIRSPGVQEAKLRTRIGHCFTLVNGYHAIRGHKTSSPSTLSGRKARVGAVLSAVLFAATLAAAQAAPPAPLEIHDHLRLEHPSGHLVAVEIEVTKLADPSLDFALPAWSPGRYAIYDFAKNVQDFSAAGSNGLPLPWSQPDKETWRVDTRTAGGTVRVQYRVFANDLNGSFSQYDTTHANLNGASIYMYVVGHKQDPVTLQVEPPAPDSKVVSGFSLSMDQHSFTASNYDRLIDTPMEISPEVAVSEFQDHGKTFRIAVHAYSESPGARKELEDGVRKIVHSEMAMMPAPDFEHYTFLFHFAPDIPAGDGMEHLNSTQIIVTQPLDAGGAGEALDIAAHEFFHLWNVKRLRPQALGPFDYAREDYTPSLWFAEGVTSYYAYRHLLGSGLWTREEFLGHLAGEIEQLEIEPGRLMMSAESSSFHAWFYDRSPQMQETNFANTTISYYNKGALVGMLLDLEIRSRTGGRKSLDDVMRAMFQKFYEAPPTTYYGRGRGYEERDILETVNAVSGSDFADFFKKYVQGTEELPYSETLAKVGLALRISTPSGSPPSLGIFSRAEDRGVRITGVIPGGAADRAGLSRDDLLINVDELSLAGTPLPDRLRMYPPGAAVPFTVERHGRRERITLKLDPSTRRDYSIVESPAATPEQKSLRDGWVGTETRK